MFIIRQTWLMVLVIGIALFISAEQALKLTNNPNFFPTVLLIGSFVVPVAFVAYMYQHERRMESHPTSPLVEATLCFLIGGVIGVVIAGVLEYQTLRGLNVPGLAGIGFIEEAAKLVFPAVLFLRGRFRSEMDGILFGVASGMGFAALETMGYGLVTFVRSSGDIMALEQVLIVRGLLSPVGHAAWTGLICAVLWRERKTRGGGLFNLTAFSAFLIAVLLHTLWNLSNSLPPTMSFLAAPGNLVVSAASLTLLIRRMREARRNSAAPAPAQG